jgi:hypothetical protein
VRQDGVGSLRGEREHGVHRGCRIGVEMPAACGAPASDFAGLAALFHEKVEGEARGGHGLLIGVGVGKKGPGINRD